MSLKVNWNVPPPRASDWTVWSETLVDPVAGGTEEHCKAFASEPGNPQRMGGARELAVRSPDGDWYRWDGERFVPRPEGGAVEWCDIDDAPVVACPYITGSCSVPA